MLVLKNCKLVSELTEGYNGDMADVVVDGEQIVAILPAGEAICDNCIVLDLQGKILLPGLIDAHLHLFMGKKNPWERTSRQAVPAQAVIDCYNYASFLLDLGYTTLRDV